MTIHGVMKLTLGLIGQNTKFLYEIKKNYSNITTRIPQLV